MKIKLILFFFTLTSLLSCVTVGHLKTDDNVQSFPETNVNKISIYSTKKIDKEYVVLGELVTSSDSERNSKTSVNFLKKEAAKLGADAIINLRLEYGTGFWTVAILSKGTAIKFINKD